MKFYIALVALFCSLFFLEAAEKQHNPRNFYVLSIPKSGSHLIIKALDMLTGKQHAFVQFPQFGAFLFPEDYPYLNIQKNVLNHVILDSNKNNRFMITHFNLAPYFSEFSKTHPKFVPILQIRDLRDILVSCAIFQWDTIEKEIGPSTMEQKLHFLITLGNKQTTQEILNIPRNAKIALNWIKKKNATVVRFENLVGKEGGGTDFKQHQEMRKLAKALNVHVSSEELAHMSQQLFGIETGPQFISTFRQGKIGSWKAHFTSQLKATFIQHMGKIQTELGYPLFVKAKKKKRSHIIIQELEWRE